VTGPWGSAAAAAAGPPTIVDIYLDRPAVIPEILHEAAAVVANYGASDRSVLDVFFGRREPKGKLPFDLPSSMAAVTGSRPDVQFDTAAPCLRFGHGLHLAGPGRDT
jgi:beta-glucosidase